MTLALRIAIGLFALVALQTAAFFVAGPERVWTRLAGPGDQGAVDIATLARRATSTDALACTPGLCAARADIALPVYPETPEALLERLDAVVLSDRRDLARVDDGTRPFYRRYLARTPIMRFPDTIDAVAVPTKAGTALGLYGRSQIGRGDWGVNLGRIEGWLRDFGMPTPVPAALGTPIS